MGWDEVPNTQVLSIRNMYGGWYPGRQYNDIPGDLQGSPIGSPDCNNVVWYDGALRKIFGFDNVNTSALNGGAAATSLYYSGILNLWLGTFGNKAYKNLDNVTPTNITGAVTITAGLLANWCDWRFSTTKFAIGVNGTDVPWKFDNTGNLAVLGGTPPVGNWCASWQDAVWIGSTASEPATLYFSNLGDAEVWSASDNYRFDATINKISPLGDKLVVFMQDHIGILSGDNNRELVKVNRYVNGIGCPSGYSVVPAKYQDKDVLIFHSGDGYYIFDGTPNPTKISAPIQNKYTGSSNIEKWNFSRLNQVCGAYYPLLGWYIAGLPSGSDTTNLFGLVLDLKRPSTSEEGVTVPHWPMDNISKAISCIASKAADDINSIILFASTDGFVYKLNTSLFNRDGSAYTSYWKSKIFDTVSNTLIQEVNVLGLIQNASTTLTVFIAGDLGNSGGISGSADFADSSDALDTDFFLGSSALAGAGSSFKNLPTGNNGRFLSFEFLNSNLNEPMIVNSIELVATTISADSNVGN